MTHSITKSVYEMTRSKLNGKLYNYGCLYRQVWRKMLLTQSQSQTIECLFIMLMVYVCLQCIYFIF